jgi:hypothetical protein
MKLKVMAAMVVLAAGGVVVLGTLGDAEKPIAVTAEADSIKVISGPCPVSTSPTQDAAKCKGSYESNGYCYCITDQVDPDGEVKEKDAPRGKVKRLWVCPAKDGKGSPVVRWDTDADVAPVGCTIAAKALTDTSMGSYDSDLVEQLRAFCSPCPVTGDSWSVCPRCGIGEPGKSDCATLCKVTTEPK